MSVLLPVQPKEGFQSPDYIFFCPGCECGHGVWVTKPNAHTKAVWSFNGNMERPTITPSILIKYEGWFPPVTPENQAKWEREPWTQEKRTTICHLFIIDGRIHYCTDSTHKLSGQVVDMQDMPN